MFEVLVFSAPWCKACAPYKDALTKAGIKFTNFNIEHAPILAEKYNIKSLPTTMVFKNNELIAKITNAVNPNVILDFTKE